MLNNPSQPYKFIRKMSGEFINTKRLFENTKNILASRYIDSVEKNMEDTFAQNCYITEAIASKVILNKSSLLIKHIYTKAMYFSHSNEVQNCLRDFGKTFSFVEKCIQDMISTAQIKIYNLQNKFDNHAFRNEHMIENKGKYDENYYDYSSEVNKWREIIDEDIKIIEDDFMKELLEMSFKTRTMKRNEFISHPSNSKYFDENTRNKALRQLQECNGEEKTSKDFKKNGAHNSNKETSQHSKKRKLTP